jgi:hypothetical protein
MKVFSKAFYRDGASCLLKTDEGTFYQDNGTYSMHKGSWYKVLCGRETEDNEVKDPELIKQLESLKWSCNQ